MKTLNAWKDESGQTIVMLALCMAVMLGFVALATDAGMLFHTKRQAQTAADAAAIAAVQQSVYGDPVTAADMDASKNGFTNGKDGTTVTVGNPPTDGPLAGKQGYIEVTVTRQEPTYFMRIFGRNSMNVTARAVATLGPTSNCVYTLDPSGTDITVAGGAYVTSSCGIYGNSSSSSDLVVGGGSTLDSSGGENLVGGYTVDNNGSLTNTPTTGIPPMPDPMAGITPPTWSAANCQSNPKLTSKTATIGPDYLGPGDYGTICYNGLTINGGDVTLKPGIYVINGPLSFGGNATVNGTQGVMFYVTVNGSIGIQSGTIANLSAPDDYNDANLPSFLPQNNTVCNGITDAPSGTLCSHEYNGILFYQDPGNTTSANFDGGAGTTLVGIMYFPTALLKLEGGTSTDTYISVVSGQVALGGNMTLHNFGELDPSDALTTPRLED